MQEEEEGEKRGEEGRALPRQRRVHRGGAWKGPRRLHGRPRGPCTTSPQCHCFIPNPERSRGLLLSHKSPPDPTVLVPSPGAPSDVCVVGPCLRWPRCTFTVSFEGVSETLN